MQTIPVWNCADGTDRAASSVWSEGTTAKTAAYTVLQSDTGKVFTNAGASGSVTFTLPTPFPGILFTFVKAVVGQNIVLDCPAGTTINNGSDGANYQNTTTEMGTCTIIGISTSKYAILAEKGTWANA